MAADLGQEAGRLAPAPEPAQARGGRLAWRWASVAATAVVVTLAGLLASPRGRTGRASTRGPIAPADRFEIDYVNVGGEPAQTFVYQPQGTDTVFVWAQKTP